jgi:hypothetical protein
MKKRVIKAAILVAGLAFLAWWGWIGNFSLTSGSFFPFGQRLDYYSLMAGQKSLGFARRDVALVPGSGHLLMTEDFSVNLNVYVATGEIRCKSTAEFAENGAILKARLDIGLGLKDGPLAFAEGEIKDGKLAYKISVGGKVRSAEAPIPEEGPILATGVIPWLARQRDLPLGRPVFFNLFDPSRLEFTPANLTVIDVSPQAAEKKTYKLSLNIEPATTEIWIDADGRVLSQKASGLDFGLDAIDNPRVLEEAKKALDAPPKPGFLGKVPKVLLDMIVSQGVGSMWPEAAGE